MVMGELLSAYHLHTLDLTYISVVGIQIKAFADDSDTDHYDIDAES